LLTYSRQKPLATTIVAVAEVVTNVSQVLRRLIGEPIAVETQVAAVLPAIRVDPSLLENALLNLALNARDAMPKGGTLLMAVDRVLVTNASGALGADLAPGVYVHFAVTDTGVGMSTVVVARAMEPFFSTKPVGSGTGLGLSMVYGFARQSGGGVALISHPGAGTTVHLYLPATEEVATAPVGHAAFTLSGVMPRSEVILVVEDDPSVRRFCLRSLSALGYPALEAEDGKAALALLDSGVHVDVLLTDVVMPNGMSGTELASILRARRKDLRVLFMSGYPAHVLETESQYAEHRLLPKPFVMAELERGLREVLAEAS